MKVYVIQAILEDGGWWVSCVAADSHAAYNVITKLEKEARRFIDETRGMDIGEQFTRNVLMSKFAMFIDIRNLLDYVVSEKNPPQYVFQQKELFT